MKKEFLGWSNEDTMLASRLVKNAYLRDKLTLNYEDIRKYLDKVAPTLTVKARVNIDEILESLTK